jgi:insulysin
MTPSPSLSLAQTARSYASFDAEQPYQHCVYYSHLLCTEKLWTHAEKLAAMPSMSSRLLHGVLNAADLNALPCPALRCAAITADDVRAFVPALLRRLHVEALVHGNVSRDEARGLLGLLDPLTAGPALSAAELVRFRHCLYGPGAYIYDSQETVHRDSAVEVYVAVCLQ